MLSYWIGIRNYIDDLFNSIPADEANFVFNILKALAQGLGLPINETNLVPLSDNMVCMGIEVEERAKTLKVRPAGDDE